MNTKHKKTSFFGLLTLVLCISCISFSSCSSELDGIHPSKKLSFTAEYKANIMALAKKYDVRIISFSSNVNKPTYKVSSLRELDSLLNDITSSKTYNCKFDKTYSDDSLKYTSLNGLSNVSRIKRRSIEAGFYSGNQSAPSVGVVMNVSLQWHSATENGALVTFLSGILPGGYSYQQQSAFTNRTSQQLIEFASSGLYTYSIDLNGNGSGAVMAVVFNTNGVVFTQTNTGTFTVN